MSIYVLTTESCSTSTHQEHAGVQSIRPRLAYELCSHLVLVSGPLVLDLQLLQPLRPRQRSLESLNSASEVILGLVEDLLGLEDVQDLGLPIEDLLSEKEVGKLLNRKIGLVTLLLEEFGSLRARGLEGFHPGRSWSHWIFQRLVVMILLYGVMRV